MTAHRVPPAVALARVRSRLRLVLLLIAGAVLGIAAAVTLAAPPTLVVVASVTAVGTAVAALAVVLPSRILRPAEELHAAQAHLRDMYEAAKADSLRDALTGLGNHRAFQEELDRQLEWFRRYKVPVALLLIDVDDLKLVNDSAGHVAGDEMLREIGRLISRSVRYADRAFRIGGDEFAILMPHTDAPGALAFARRLLGQATHPGQPRAFPFSGGVSACPSLATTRAQLYAQADAALYWCKRHGRSAVDVFDPARDRADDQEATQEASSAVARVASGGLLRPVYQPIVDLQTGTVLGFEGLVRPAPESGFSDAGSLFAAAEAAGRTVELDHACLEAVAAGARTVPEDQLISINLSPRTVEGPDFSATGVAGVLARHGLSPTRVVLELTERERVEDLDRLRANLTALQAAGFRVAADDVGAGNAGLRLLSQFRFDIVKVDLSLVQEGALRDSSRAVLRSLRDLASRWGAFVIAEGLETAEQLGVVRELGISAGQGYLLARPAASVEPRHIDVHGLAEGRLVMRASPLPDGRVPVSGRS